MSMNYYQRWLERQYFEYPEGFCRQGCLCEIYFIFKKFWKRSRYVCRIL